MVAACVKIHIGALCRLSWVVMGDATPGRISLKRHLVVDQVIEEDVFILPQSHPLWALHVQRLFIDCAKNLVVCVFLPHPHRTIMALHYHWLYICSAMRCLLSI